ncbi:hypothetical protein [Streptantibioticus ferralitis]|uniref:Uncharacterized protein n=1 Tax=Streptantibioticus ferralitis TaxID=236510 RepID=A0ABT5YX18_9ACTN|nr:hypothetical protein [Streptantibioticus ferralitis]MDF2256018.1 hypothetical protein [Streptantibioticus ferralitis]
MPCAIVFGPLFTAYIWPWVRAEIPESALAAFTTTTVSEDCADGAPRRELPCFSLTIGTVLLPIALMMLKAVRDTAQPSSGRAAAIRRRCRIPESATP